MSGLGLYSPTRNCPKCGSHMTITDYHRRYQLMKRSCARCSYYWYERPLDSEVKVAAESGTEPARANPASEGADQRHDDEGAEEVSEDAEALRRRTTAQESDPEGLDQVP